MKIKEVCEQTNLTRRAVRFYEEKGLIRPAVTQGNEYRDYSPEDVQQLRLVARLREYRFSVEQIRRLLESPSERAAVFAEHTRELRGEHEECTSILKALEGISLPQSTEPNALYDALNREEAPLPARDLEPDFGRFDELTGEERAALARQAVENVERRERSRLRLRAGLAAALAVLLCAGTALGLWIHSENTELMLFSGMGSDVVFLDTDVPNDGGLLLAEMEMEFPADSPIPSGIYRIPFEDSPAGSALSSSLLPGEVYAGLSITVSVPKREARALGLLQPDGSLNIDAVLPRVFQDQDFALRYARIAQVHSGV